MNRLLLKILWNNQSKWQFLFAIGGFVIGVFIMLASLQLYIEVKNILFKSEKDKQNDYLIINKQVTLANTFSKGQSSFTPEDLDTLKMQPFIKSIGVFETSTFSVQAKLQMQFGFSPDIFFEAVPDEYIDNKPEEFVWEEGNEFVPIIISNEFLNIYNFGVAMSSKMPQLPKEAIQMFPFNIVIFNKKENIQFSARVIGFTDRIPTVLVPLSFMKWANKTYGTTESPAPQRVLIEVTEKDENFKKFLTDRNYITNQEQLKSDNTRKILNLVVGIITVVGALFVILSFVIFIINFQLLISRAKYEIEVIMNLGYSYNAISNVLNFQLFSILGISYAAIVAALYTVFKKAGVWANEKGIEVSGVLSLKLILTGISIVLLLMLLNNITLRMSLRK
jgi:hypothetical protein